MRRETAIVLGLLVIVLVPLWFIAIASGGNSFEQIAIQTGQNVSVAPTGTFMTTPTEISVYTAGVVSWLALFGLVGALFLQVRYAHNVGRRTEAIVPEEGDALPYVPSFVENAHRRVVAYYPAGASLRGVWLTALFTFLSVVFAALFAGEALGLARNQFLGFYGGILAFSLAETVLMYYTHFMPTIEVAEARDH
ncbi:hypotheical protein [Halarchaeum acidiphilum MH1-52-1]|uniref:Hypotheical protein n=1 Tax=Halarchaeum acidiphilum MH1-52-1 TaxID=1261545 RepID=U2YGP2_9EURY|nr:hypothetical protein [Halarchaeum acidiphilum]GAD53506.1 hypotheical protein [Halarchaeum acidiphilum MH1-52-1]